jgi:hypothetical protein
VKLTGKQIGELTDALIDAFDQSSFDRMLTIELDKRLDMFSGPDDLQSMIFELIRAAERQGWTEDLIRGARRANPGNEQLKTVATALLGGGTTQKPEPSQPTIPTIDPVDPPILQIRTLLRNAYSATTLKQFCNDRRGFREVLRRIGPNEGLDGVIDKLLEYCRTNLLWEELLGEVAEDKPAWYKVFLQEF